MEKKIKASIGFRVEGSSQNSGPNLVPRISAVMYCLLKRGHNFENNPMLRLWLFVYQGLDDVV